MFGSFGMGFAVYSAGPSSDLPFFVLPFFLFARMALNAVDGMIASEYSLRTPSGALLNEIGDVLSDAAVYLPFAILPGLPGTLIVAAVVMALVAELAGVLGQALGAGRRFDGPMGKSDRAVAFGLIGLGYAWGLRGETLWTAVIAVLLLLLAATVLNRCRAALARVQA